jgi:hypothetical protein
MGLYSRALSNIEKALQHNYPQKGIDKLAKREELCKAMLKEGEEPSNMPLCLDRLKLSHKPNAKYPPIADCLKLKYDKKFGRFVITEKKLAPGEIVACEEPFSKCLLPDHNYRYCATCLSDNFFDLFACSVCTSVMFCSEKCHDIGFKKFHQYECTIIDRLNEICTKIMRISSHTFFEALYIYDSNIDRLMAGIEESQSANVFDFDLNESSSIDQNRRNLLTCIDSLVTSEAQRSPSDFFQRSGIVAIMVHLYLNFTKLKTVFKTERARDFYVRFIVKQTQIAAQNYHGIFDGVFKHKTSTEQYGSASYPFCSLINHSCAPNVVRVSYNCINYLMVNRPIKAGGQLFDNYGYHHCLEVLSKRQKSLKNQYMFDCTCAACEHNYPSFFDLKSGTNSFKIEASISDDIAQLSALSLDTAKTRFDDYCKMLAKVDKFYPCKETSSLQECILQCFFIFKMTPFKLRLMN